MDSPRHLQIEPTTRCNFTCGFCCGRSMEQADMPYERFIAVLDAFPDLEHIELQGEGESLMHPRFWDMVTEARGRGIRVSFISNGSLLTSDAIDRLLELGIDKISISIESPDEDQFREIRGGKLSKVLRNLENLMSERDRRGLDLPVVGLSITVLRSTRHRLHDILALYRRLGLDGGITLQPLQRMDAYAQNYQEQMEAEALDDDQVEAIWHSFFADKQLRHIEKSRAATRGFFDELMDTWRPATGKCPWLERGLYVNNRGEVSGCCMIKDTAAHGFGRIGEDTHANILARRDALRTELATGKIPTPCRGCELARFATMKKSKLVGFGLRGLWARLLGGPGRPRDAQEQLVQLRTNRSD